MSTCAHCLADPHTHIHTHTVQILGLLCTPHTQERKHRSERKGTCPSACGSLQWESTHKLAGA